MKRRAAAAATRCEVAVATRAEADPIAGCLMRPGGGMEGGGSGDRLEVRAMGTRASKAKQRQKFTGGPLS
jgi:hypothetical protein